MGSRLQAAATALMPPTITPTLVEASPNDSALEAPLCLRVRFNTDADIAAARWTVRYLVDMTGRRHVVEVGEDKGPLSYSASGEHEWQLNVPGIDLTGVKKSWLQNVGLLLVCMLDAGTGEEIVQISCVVQVAKRGDEHVRTIMSPLD